MVKIIVNSDGGARGNPGPAAVGVVISCNKDGKREILAEISKFIGEKTNNQAEYQGVIEALRWIDENEKEDIDAEFLLD